MQDSQLARIFAHLLLASREGNSLFSSMLSGSRIVTASMAVLAPEEIVRGLSEFLGENVSSSEQIFLRCPCSLRLALISGHCVSLQCGRLILLYSESETYLHCTLLALRRRRPIAGLLSLANHPVPRLTHCPQWRDRMETCKDCHWSPWLTLSHIPWITCCPIHRPIYLAEVGRTVAQARGSGNVAA